jgi:hypothetical protein
MSIFSKIYEIFTLPTSRGDAGQDGDGLSFFWNQNVRIVLAVVVVVLSAFVVYWILA